MVCHPSKEDRVIVVGMIIGMMYLCLGGSYLLLHDRNGQLGGQGQVATENSRHIHQQAVHGADIAV